MASGRKLDGSPTSRRSSVSRRAVGHELAIVTRTLVGSRASGYPRIAFHAGGLLFAGVGAGDGRSQIQTAAARVPPATAR